MKLGPWFLVIALFWCVAVLLKITVARGRREPYRFTQWDGGLLLRGRELGAAGTAALAVFAVGLGAIAAYHLVRWTHL